MTSYLSRLNPVPGFPEYTGPYKVGSIDVELPISELDSPSPSPDESISTVQYQIFYPCEPDAKGKGLSWIPTPQREYVSAYARFVGAGTKLAEFISFFPRILHYISIPVRKNAALLSPPTSNTKWPVMIFSHGLGGTRNAYSHLVGSLASHGMIVIAPEHRDGSGPVSFIRDAPSTSHTEKTSAGTKKRKVEYVKLSHNPSREVEEGRNAQLRVRLWEMGIIHSSLLKLDTGDKLTNLDTSSAPLSAFATKLDVHRPGKITFAGHSFGASTVTQFVKSVYYSPKTASAPSDYTPLFTPSSRSEIVSQITPQTPVVLLDAWCLPLRAASTRWLWDLPFPCYTPGGPGPSNLLAVESQAFFKWNVHLKSTKRLLSSDPSTASPRHDNRGEPHFFYAATSAHLSQSDFGILFPYLTKRFLAIEEPERILRLNVRAITQLLRNNDIEVGPTSRADLEMEEGSPEATNDDKKILAKGAVRGWVFISTNSDDAGDEVSNKGKVEDTQAAAPSDAVLGNEFAVGSEGTKTSA
ncbi:alpha/beta-Hydrolase [Glarea lozoyensis ATCC 20868]|uniref:Putative phospholipase n=1 Tax=Glarea lozoyensis (strain ATCC 20868 / MF5171) TaxID=1116229 RepID=S3DMZ3_GLAL2|nr:alpha/beta-Hydrolase [Glarea lozoyensis ATCC 20868]EPE33466.1 alpha/beta-Hydrolase [Glarea lozoyensis ATCC 20868]